MVAFAGRFLAFADRTNIKKVIAYVFFTTATKNLTRTPTTPTGVRRKPIEGVKYCCIFYR
jgi:hypothetical protein